MLVGIIYIKSRFKFQEVEHEAPNNAFVIIVFGVLGMILQVCSLL